jgi:hypothetical protein
MLARTRTTTAAAAGTTMGVLYETKEQSLLSSSSSSATEEEWWYQQHRTTAIRQMTVPPTPPTPKSSFLAMACRQIGFFMGILLAFCIPALIPGSWVPITTTTASLWMEDTSTSNIPFWSQQEQTNTAPSSILSENSIYVPGKGIRKKRGNTNE